MISKESGGKSYIIATEQVNYSNVKKRSKTQ